MTGFGKTCIVHTYNFSTLVSHKIHLEWWIDVKLSGIVELLFLYDFWKFHICIPFPVVLCISKWAKSDVWTMHIFPNPVTYSYVCKQVMVNHTVVYAIHVARLYINLLHDNYSLHVCNSMLLINSFSVVSHFSTDIANFVVL